MHVICILAPSTCYKRTGKRKNGIIKTWYYTVNCSLACLQLNFSGTLTSWQNTAKVSETYCICPINQLQYCKTSTCSTGGNVRVLWSGYTVRFSVRTIRISMYRRQKKTIFANTAFSSATAPVEAPVWASSAPSSTCKKLQNCGWNTSMNMTYSTYCIILYLRHLLSMEL